jgi:hypothetical protein
MAAVRVIFICLLFGTACFAQKNYYKENSHLSFNGGLEFGLDFTQVDGDSYYGYNKIGLNAGGIVVIHFTSVIGASMELLYSQKGSRSVGSSSSTTAGVFDETYTMKLNYAEVPLMVRYTYNKLVEIESGISYAYLINSAESAQLNGQPVFIDPDLNRFNSTDIEYIVGFNVKAVKQFAVDCRFAYSITNIRPIERVPAGFSYGTKGQFNNIFVLRVVYLL